MNVDKIPSFDNDAFMAELEKGVRTLSRRDPVIRALAKENGPPVFRPHGDYFDTLVEAIISQQISSAAAASILRKLKDVLGGFFEPGIMLAAPEEQIRGAGISPQKLGYLRSLAEHAQDGRLEIGRFNELSDDEIIRELTDIKGIGVWTAHMFLIFSLGRLDVLPVGDFGVKRGIQVAYGLDEPPKPREIAALAEARKWAPYRSIASWYMWRVP